MDKDYNTRASAQELLDLIEESYETLDSSNYQKLEGFEDLRKFKIASSVLKIKKDVERYYMAIVISNDDYKNPVFQNIYGLPPDVICVQPAREKIIQLLKKSNFNG